MEKYLRIKFLQKTFDVHVDVIKEHHVQLLSESNRIHFGIERSNFDSAERITETLFTNDNYTLNWINRNIRWGHIAEHLLNVDECNYHGEWDIAEKVIVKRSSMKKEFRSPGV